MSTINTTIPSCESNWNLAYQIATNLSANSEPTLLESAPTSLEIATQTPIFKSHNLKQVQAAQFIYNITKNTASIDEKTLKDRLLYLPSTTQLDSEIQKTISTWSKHTKKPSLNNLKQLFLDINQIVLDCEKEQQIILKKEEANLKILNDLLDDKIVNEAPSISEAIFAIFQKMTMHFFLIFILYRYITATLKYPKNALSGLTTLTTNSLSLSPTLFLSLFLPFASKCMRAKNASKHRVDVGLAMFDFVSANYNIKSIVIQNRQIMIHPKCKELIKAYCTSSCKNFTKIIVMNVLQFIGRSTPLDLVRPAYLLLTDKKHLFLYYRYMLYPTETDQQLWADAAGKWCLYFVINKILTATWNIVKPHLL